MASTPRFSIPDTLAANADSLLELRALVGRLSDADLAHPLGGGWTVGSALGHLAFWDMRAAVMADRWKIDNAISGANIDDEGVNEALEPLLLAVSGRAVATMAIAAAAAANMAMNRLPPELLSQALAEGAVFNGARHAHRREHIEQIGRVLAAS
ncbi:MAG: hypothetical protein C4558_09265 [Dehalococcoidia bacterium]|nr:MAG: hypothetical protein C4558_09265 [Dehalococcoidia bacterium]